MSVRKLRKLSLFDVSFQSEVTEATLMSVSVAQVKYIPTGSVCSSANPSSYVTYVFCYDYLEFSIIQGKLFTIHLA